MGLKRKTSLLASALMLSANFLMPASTFAAGAGTGGLSFYDYLAANADKDTVIDFNEAPTTGNVVDEFGNIISDIGGLYMLQSTKDDEKPVYFFRGNVDNNHVVLNDFCWLIVRTTETGGTKLLYNGKPNNEGVCVGDSEADWSNLTSPDEINSVIGFSPFNEKYTSPADFGYMYGERYEASFKNFDSDNTVFGNDVTYSNGAYTLQDTVTGGVDAYKGYHYTCLTSGITCSEVYYEIFRLDEYDRQGNFLTFTNGDTVATAVSKMAGNEHDSTIKKYIEDWYSENMIEATDYLEDAVWYGSKSFVAGSLSTKDSDFSSVLGNNGASLTRETIDAYCPNIMENDLDGQCKKSTTFDYLDPNGIFTTANGLLRFPVGLLTGSEMIMAGNGDRSSFVQGTYIDNGIEWWGISPSSFHSGTAVVVLLRGDIGYSDINYSSVGEEAGVRPAVSLKPTLMALEGDGSKDNPFRELVEVEDSEDGEDTPDNADESTPVNPQTSDVFLPATLAVVVLASAAFVAVKRNTSR